MSRRGAQPQSVASTSSSAPTTMGPPPDRDVVMGPPPVPPQMTVNLTPTPKPNEQEVVAKYSSLKRKYFDLEEKYKEATAELQRSGERNVRLGQERRILLDRIIELEALTKGPIPSPSHAHGPGPFPSSSAFPRSLLNHAGRNHFVANLRQAGHEIEHEDPSIDPVFTSRHVGPQGRKREEERDRRLREAIMRESHRAMLQGSDESARKGVKRARGGKARDVAGGSAGEGTPPVLVSSGGTRLRLKPPAPPSEPGMSPRHGHPSPMQHPTSAHFHQPSQPPMISPHQGRPDMRHEQQHYTYPPPGSPHDEREMHHHSPSAGSFRPRSPQSYFHHPGQPQHAPSNGHGHGHVHSPPLPVALPRAERTSKPKRLKAHTVASKVYNIPTIPRDRKGKPILPLNVGIMVVLSLGEVCMREHFHNERYIYPVGYVVQRRYLSMIDPHKEVNYTCSILDGGDGPKFQVVPDDQPGHAIISGTATGAWATVVKQANLIRDRQHSNSVSGPDFFGMTQHSIKHLIQELPGADMLRDYVWQHFVEGGRPLGGRHAAVIPAYPDEQEGSQSGYPVGEAYPPNQEREMYMRESSRPATQFEDDLFASLPSQPSSRSQPPLNIRVEYPEGSRPPSMSGRERSRRRSSRASEQLGNGHGHGHPEELVPPSPMHRSGSHRSSHSPVMHREREREHHYSLPPPQSPATNHPPYRAASGGSNGSYHPMSTSPPPPVPAGLASIMNPVGASRLSGSPPSDSDYRRSGNGSNGHS